MPDILATVTMPFTTGLPEDVAINTFAFADTNDPGLTADITDLLVDFYTFDVGGLNIGNFISEVVDRNTNACKVELAEIVDAGPTVDVGPIFYTDTFTMTPANDGSGAVSLPLEVAVVNSVRNSDGAGSVARRRGRQYIGPLDMSAINTTGPYPLVASALIALLSNRSDALQAASVVADCPWSVWSRTAGTLFPIDSGFIDNEFDTQRRRGVDATARTSWSNLV